MKAWKITLSGTYVDGAKQTQDYQDLVGVIPLVPEDQIQFWAGNRCVQMWVIADKETYPQRFGRVREVFVDNVEEVNVDAKEFGFVGKNIKDMTYEDLQMLAICKGIPTIPHFKTGSLRTQREVAYKEYHKEVLKDEVLDDFNYGKAPDLVVGDANVRIFKRHQVRNDLSHLAPTELDEGMSLDDLKKIADSMGLKYKSNASKKTLMQMITGKAA